MQTLSRKRNQRQIYTVVIIALLSALGYVLMMIGKVVPFGTFSFLEVEISDLTVILAYSLSGFISSIAVAIIKTLLTALTFGFVGTPIPIGQIAALIASCLYAVLVMVADKVFKFASKPLHIRIIFYIVLVLIISTILAFLNYLFITPTFLCYGDHIMTCYDVFSADENSAITEALESYFGAINASYTATIFILYLPFNALKGVLIFIVYELLMFKAIPPIERAGVVRVNLCLEKASLYEILTHDLR